MWYVCRAGSDGVYKPFPLEQWPTDGEPFYPTEIEAKSVCDVWNRKQAEGR